MAREPTSDAELVRQTAGGSPEALGELYERHEALVAGFLISRTRDRELAADLTAETFATAALAAARFRDDGHGAAGWLVGIARNLLSRSRRRGAVERRARERLGIEAVAVGDNSLERVEALLDAKDPDNPYLLALAGLPAEQRAAIEAHVLEERSYAEVAAHFGVAEATVRQRVSRGLARLRTSFPGDAS